MVLMLLIAIPVGCMLGVLAEFAVQRTETTGEWLLDTDPAGEGWLADAHPKVTQQLPVDVSSSSRKFRYPRTQQQRTQQQLPA